MSKNTKIANAATIIGVASCLAIAQLPFSWCVGIMTVTVLGCDYLTKKKGE